MASLTIIMGQPLAYLIGWLIPVSLGPSLTARSTEYGEFFTGLVWGIAICLL